MAKTQIKSVESISELEITTVVNLREVVAQQEQQLQSVRERLAFAEATLVGKLRQGLSIDSRKWAASLQIDVVKGRCSPKWKDEYITHFVAEHKTTAELIELEMKAKYPAKSSEVESLVISGKK